MTMAGPFLTPKQHEEGSFIGCHGYPVCDTMATTTCFLWFCQEMNERSLHLQRYFATRNHTLPCVWESSQWPLLHAWTLAAQTFMARDLVFDSQGKHTFEGKVSDSKMLKVFEAWLQVPAISGINGKQEKPSWSEVRHFVGLHPILPLGSCSSAAPDTVRQIRTLTAMVDGRSTSRTFAGKIFETLILLETPQKPRTNYLICSNQAWTMDASNASWRWKRNIGSKIFIEPPSRTHLSPCSSGGFSRMHQAFFVWKRSARLHAHHPWW